MKLMNLCGFVMNPCEVYAEIMDFTMKLINLCEFIMNPCGFYAEILDFYHETDESMWICHESMWNINKNPGLNLWICHRNPGF